MSLRISASTIKSLESCALQVWYNKVEKIPDEAHWKTRVGSICHDIIEMLVKPDHLEYKMEWLAGKLTEVSLRLIRMKIRQYHLEEHAETVTVDVPILVRRALFYYKILEKRKYKFLPPEYAFELDVNGTVLKGFIDQLSLINENKYLITDWKSQKTPFSKDELEYNIQAILYQYAIFKLFDVESDVEFVMLRQKETSKNFIQRVPFVGRGTLMGFEDFLAEQARYFKAFNYKTAIQTTAFSSGDTWKCNFCTYKNPFKYYVRYDAEGNLIKYSYYKSDMGDDYFEMNFPGCACWKEKL